MTSQAIVEQESTIFRKRRHKGMERWFVRVACNFLNRGSMDHFRRNMKLSAFGKELSLNSENCWIANSPICQEIYTYQAFN